MNPSAFHLPIFALALLLPSSPALAYSPSDLQRLLADSHAPWWDCKTLAIRSWLERNPQQTLPDWRFLKGRNDFRERARLEVRPAQVLSVTNALPITDALLERYRKALLPILPRGVKATEQLQSLRQSLVDLGYNALSTTHLAGYWHQRLGFLGYISLTDDPIFKPCAPTPFAKLPADFPLGIKAQIRDAQSLTYLGFLAGNAPARLVRVLGEGTRVQDVFSGQRFRVLTAQGKPVPLARAPVKVQPSAPLPLVLDIRLKAE